MIKLNLAIYEGNIQVIDFNSKYELTEFILVIKQSNFNCVWLATDDSSDGELIVTENIDTIIHYINNDLFDIKKEIHLHEYQSYEDAYYVALDMREPNPKCYPNEQN